MSIKAKIVFFLVCIYFIGVAFGYNILLSNTSSLPYFLFVKTPNKEDLKTGSIVTFIYKYKDYYKYKVGQNFTKKIGCSQGEELKTVDNQFFCNGKFIGVAAIKDGVGNELEVQDYNEIIPNGKYFMIGTNPKSFDSKYYGYIDKSDISGVTYGIF
ncbi:MAG: signal peptidase I [Campylobacterota bacterium]